MPSIPLDIAYKVRDVLDGETFSSPIIVDANLVSEENLQVQTPDIRVTVTPTTREATTAARKYQQHTAVTAIYVRKRIRAPELTELDEPLQVCDEILQVLFANRRLTLDSGELALFSATTQTVIYDSESMMSLNQFTSVIQATYEVMK